MHNVPPLRYVKKYLKFDPNALQFQRIQRQLKDKNHISPQDIFTESGHQKQRYTREWWGR